MKKETIVDMIGSHLKEAKICYKYLKSAKRLFDQDFDKNYFNNVENAIINFKRNITQMLLDLRICGYMFVALSGEKDYRIQYSHFVKWANGETDFVVFRLDFNYEYKYFVETGKYERWY